MLTIAQPFWREEPLSEREEELLRLLFEAHNLAVDRQNPSSAAVINAGIGSGDYTKAIASALLSIGGLHAPIAETMDLLRKEEPVKYVNSWLATGVKVPGWGSSFEKGRMAEEWDDYERHLRDHFAIIYGKIVSITDALHVKGKMIFPNPSAYTAAAAIVLGIPAPFAAYLFIAARLDGWSKLLLSNV